METKRVVCYMNQFFGQVGGEDQAAVGFSVLEKPVGPAVLVGSTLGDFGEVVACIICGDNYMADNPETAVPEGLDLIEKYKPDLFIAGPAFNAGRYGMNCGRMCKAVAEKFGIPTVTGMYEENPGAELYRKNTYIVKTTNSAGGMKNAVPKMVSIGKRLITGEEIKPAKLEGYIKRDSLRNYMTEEYAGERGIKMLLARLKGEPYESEAEFPTFAEYDSPPPITDLKKAKVAIVSDGGLVPMGNPDGLRDHNSTAWGEYKFSQIFGTDIEVYHTGYDSTYVQQDPNRLYPVDVLKELVEAGEIGELYDGIFVASGNCASISAAQNIGKQIAQRFKDEGISAAILTSTWGTSTRCGATINSELEKAGIPVVQIASVTDAAMLVGVSRLIRGYRLICPASDFTLDKDSEKESRRRYVKRAMDMLKKPGQKNHFEVVKLVDAG